MPARTMDDSARRSEGVSRLEIPSTKGEKLRLVIMNDLQIEGRRHFVQLPEEGKVTTVACELDYTDSCPFCDVAQESVYGGAKVPVDVSKSRYVVPVLVFDQASKKSGHPMQALVDKETKLYVGEYTPAIWEFGWVKDWNKLVDIREYAQDQNLEGAEIILEVVNPGNKQLEVSSPPVAFFNSDDRDEFEEVFDSYEKIETFYVGPRLSAEDAQELISNSGVESTAGDDEDVEDPFAE